MAKKYFTVPGVTVDSEPKILYSPAMMTREIAEIIGARIRSTRVDAGFTQAELAALVRVLPQRISLWETGESTPSTDHVVAVAAALGVSADYLLGIDR